MLLNVHKVAELLNVSEKTIYRWIRQNEMPALKIRDQYRFNRTEILEWVTARRINVSPNIFHESENERIPMPGLSESLKAGGIHYRVGGADKETALQSAVDVMPLPDEVDRSFLVRVLVARESLGSTGVGDGIAIPHVRNPIVMHIPRPLITLCFLDRAIEFGALDGKPVHTLFTMVSPTISAHLSLLSKLSFALRFPAFAGVIARQGTREEILAAASAADSGMPQRSGSPVEVEGDT